MSLEPQEFLQMAQIIRAVESTALSSNSEDEILRVLAPFDPSKKELRALSLALSEVTGKSILDSEIPCKIKLGKSLVYRRALRRGAILTKEDVCVKVSEPNGIPAELIDDFLGRELHRNVDEEANVSEDHFE